MRVVGQSNSLNEQLASLVADEQELQILMIATGTLILISVLLLVIVLIRRKNKLKKKAEPVVQVLQSDTPFEPILQTSPAAPAPVLQSSPAAPIIETKTSPAPATKKVEVIKTPEPSVKSTPELKSESVAAIEPTPEPTPSPVKEIQSETPNQITESPKVETVTSTSSVAPKAETQPEVSETEKLKEIEKAIQETHSREENLRLLQERLKELTGSSHIGSVTEMAEAKKTEVPSTTEVEPELEETLQTPEPEAIVEVSMEIEPEAEINMDDANAIVSSIEASIAAIAEQHVKKLEESENQTIEAVESIETTSLEVPENTASKTETSTVYHSPQPGTPDEKTFSEWLKTLSTKGR